MRVLHKKRNPRGVVYLSHVPHGFFEEEMEAYFSQFGTVTAVSVPRSKTGRIRGYAFIEFKHSGVAKVAAEAMDNYLMFNRILKAKCIPHNLQKSRLFLKAKEARENLKTAADRASLAVKHNRKLKNRHLTLRLEARCAVRLLERAKLLKSRAKGLGIRHSFDIGEDKLKSVFDSIKK